MPVVQSSDDTATSIVSSQDGMTSMRGQEMNEEEKYWKLKLMHSALSSVLFSTSPDPRFTPEALNHLQKMFLGSADSNEINDLLPQEIPVILQDCVANELARTCHELIVKTTDLLKSSDAPDDRESLVKINRISNNPMDEVLKIIQRQKEQQLELNKKIAAAADVKVAKVHDLEGDVAKVKSAIERVIRLAIAYKQPERIETKIEILARKSEYLDTLTERAREEQMVLENPPAVANLTVDVGEKLTTAKEKLVTENKVLSEFLQKYDSLDLDMKELLSQLRSTEEAIERQRWILDRMKGFEASDDFGAETFF